MANVVNLSPLNNFILLDVKLYYKVIITQILNYTTYNSTSYLYKDPNYNKFRLSQ